MFPFWNFLELRMMAEVATTGAVRHAKFKSDRRHQHPTFYRLDDLVFAQPTVSTLKEIIMI